MRNEEVIVLKVIHMIQVFNVEVIHLSHYYNIRDICIGDACTILCCG